jgi:hypothetical protein
MHGAWLWSSSELLVQLRNDIFSLLECIFDGRDLTFRLAELFPHPLKFSAGVCQLSSESGCLAAVHLKSLTHVRVSPAHRASNCQVVLCLGGSQRRIEEVHAVEEMVGPCFTLVTMARVMGEDTQSDVIAPRCRCVGICGL